VVSEQDLGTQPTGAVPPREPARQEPLDELADVREGGERARREADAAHEGRRAAEASAARMRAMVAGLNAIVWERGPDTWRFRAGSSS
jgi:hypothetical protein